jgi:hypothetical protein
MAVMRAAVLLMTAAGIGDDGIEGNVFFSSVSCLNSSTFLHFILVYFFEFHFLLNSLSAMDGIDHPLLN